MNYATERATVSLPDGVTPTSAQPELSCAPGAMSNAWLCAPLAGTDAAAVQLDPGRTVEVALSITTAAVPSSGGAGAANRADILERVLDKGIVIAGDIQINLLDIELLTIKLRLLVASVDKAREMGIDWWENDAALSSQARKKLEKENDDLRARLERLESAVALGKGSGE